MYEARASNLMAHWKIFCIVSTYTEVHEEPEPQGNEKSSVVQLNLKLVRKIDILGKFAMCSC